MEMSSDGLGRALREIERRLHRFYIVDHSELEELRSQIDEAVVADWEEYKGLPGKEKFIALDLVNHGPAFVRMLENDKMHEVFSHFLGDTCIVYSFTSTVVYPHQKQYTCDIHTDTPRLIPDYHLGLLTLALDDFTENGATFYLPGCCSLKSLRSRSSTPGSAFAVGGDATFFTHASGMQAFNHRTNRAEAVPSMHADMDAPTFDYPRMVNREVLSLLGERGRAFLGFNVLVPTSMREFYAPPEQRLYRGGQG
jgi:ectoine hydroxylase-related dioxygenase (phytanoyl-CoA dioxygenase family)